jgi:hypothetical protein
LSWKQPNSSPFPRIASLAASRDHPRWIIPDASFGDIRRASIEITNITQFLQQLLTYELQVRLVRAETGEGQWEEEHEKATDRPCGGASVDRCVG